MKQFTSPFFALLCLSPLAQAVVTVSDFSTAWTPFLGNYDYLADQQTGQAEGDIVGLDTVLAPGNHGFFMAFNDNGTASNTDGQLLFRMRLDKAGGNTNNPAFDRVMWVGIDANSDGSLDAFIGLNRQGNSSDVGLYLPGTGANTSPSTTSIVSNSPSNIINPTSASNYNYRPVNFTNDGGTTNDITTSTSGDPDYYVSFMVPFADVVAFLSSTKSINITDQTSLRFVMATSTQTNSLNQDLGGVNGGVGSTTTWAALGAFTSSSPLAVPEPTTGLLALGSVAALLIRRRR